HREKRAPGGSPRRASQKAGTGGPAPIVVSNAVLRVGQVDGRLLARALVALQLVADALAFVQRAEARAFDGGDVDEHVLAAILRLDEAVALLAVDPLYGALRHFSIPSGYEFSRPVIRTA